MKILARIMYRVAVLNRVTGWRLSRVNRWIYRFTGGLLGDVTPGANVVLMTTLGWRSGRPHTVPVAAWWDGDGLVVGSFAGGSERDPQWLKNLRIRPKAEVQRKRERFSVRAELIPQHAWDETVERIAKTQPLIDFYARRTERKAPMVRLVRV